MSTYGTNAQLSELIGEMDIYLLDQILKGRFIRGSKILDVGCGKGRNLIYFLREGYQVYGLDPISSNIAYVQILAENKVPSHHFRVETIEASTFPEAYFDSIICNAVLHFAQDEEHFLEMVQAMWKKLKPSGFWFARLASSVGIENEVQRLEGGRFLLPDGTQRFLVNTDLLIRISEDLGSRFVEPIKTVQVHKQRSMTNWVLTKC